jgi:hypothetical protein
MLPTLLNMKLYAFGQVANDVRFLEDQDGSAAWEPISPRGYEGFEIEEAFQQFKKYFDMNPNADVLREGFHFIDIPVGSATDILRVPRRIKMYITDIEEPDRLLATEDDTLLDMEPCGELDIQCLAVSAGGSSEFLPEVYKSLYEAGNIIM